MSKSANKQVLTLMDVASQVISMAASSKDGLGTLLTGTLYEALSSTLVDIEETPGVASGTTSVILTNNEPQNTATRNSAVVEVGVPFLTAVVSAGPTWPTTLLLTRLLSYINFDSKNITVYSLAVKGLIKVLSSKDVIASRIASLECLGVFLKSKSLALSDVLRTNDLFDQLMKQIKMTSNTPPQSQLRTSLFRCLESLIQGVAYGNGLNQLNELLLKIVKYWTSCSEKSLATRNAAMKMISTWIPYAAASYNTSSAIQAILMKDIGACSSVGVAYGNLLFVALKESLVPEAVAPSHQIPPQKPGYPPHDLTGITGIKEIQNLDAILEHLQSNWTKIANRRDCRESLACCYVTLFSKISFTYLEKNLARILPSIVSLVSSSVSSSNSIDIQEVKSSVSYILRSGIIHHSSDEGKRLIFLELFNILSNQSTRNNQTQQNDPIRTFLLAEIYALFSSVGESIVGMGASSGNSTMIEDTIHQILTQQAVELNAQAQKSASSLDSDGNSIWLWCGLILKRYSAVNDQYFLRVDQLVNLMPSPIGKLSQNANPLPAVWAYSCTKRTRPASSEEFGIVLQIVQSLLAAGTQNINFSIAGWILLSSLLLRGSGQSAEQDRTSMVSAHLATLQHLWKQELSKRPTSDSDLYEFALTKLWLLYSLKHFLSNFSRLAHEANLTTFITQCLNTVLKSVSTWQGTNHLPKTEKEASAIDAMLVALLQSYTMLATHIYNPPSASSPGEAPIQDSSQGSTQSAFPARSVLQMIAKQMIRTRYIPSPWLTHRYLHLEDEALDLNTTPMDGIYPSSSRLYHDLHACTMTLSSCNSLVWSEWSWQHGLTSSKNSNKTSSSFLIQQMSDPCEMTSIYLSPATQLLNEMTALFPPLFHQQQPPHQLQLLQYLASCLASNSSHIAPVHANVLFFLLAIARENAKHCGSHQLSTLMMSSTPSATSKPLTKEILSNIMSLAQPYLTSALSILRRLAAEILAYAIDADEAGHLAPTVKSLQQTLSAISSSTASAQALSKLVKEESSICGAMFALAAIHRVVGGIRSRQYLAETIKTLVAVVRVTFDTRPLPSSTTPATNAHVMIHRTALHSLWIALEATGLSDTSFASSALGLMLDGLISDVSKEWQTVCYMGRIIASIAQALGPELQGSITLLRRLQGVLTLLECVGRIEVEEAAFSYNSSLPASSIQDWVPPRTAAITSLSFDAAIVLRERLLLFAPQFIDASKTRAKLLNYINIIHRHSDFEEGSKDALVWSPISRMRLNALRVLIFLAQLNPQAFQDGNVVKEVVFGTDREPLSSAINLDLKVLISTLEETLIPLDPLKWLHYAMEFVLGNDESGMISGLFGNSTAISKPEIQSPSIKSRVTATKPQFSKPVDDEDMPEGEPMDTTEEESGSLNTMQSVQVERISSADDSSVWKLSSSLTSIFVSTIQHVIHPLEGQKIHFDAILAAKKRKEDEKKGIKSSIYLVDTIQGIVALASKSSLASTAAQQNAGLEAIHQILSHFSEAKDPELEGHYLLELYVAQLSAALRRCIPRESAVANRVCHASYIVLAEMILWISKHVSDVNSLRQLIRPFLDPSLEKKNLHYQKFNTSNRSEANKAEEDLIDVDSPISLELNPRYVAWLISSSVLWDGSSSLDPKLIYSKNMNDSDHEALQNVGDDLNYLQQIFLKDKNLRSQLRSGWMALLEYRSVQQYSQDLTQLTLFGASHVAQNAATVQSNIFERGTLVGVDWTTILVSMATQFAENVTYMIETHILDGDDIKTDQFVVSDQTIQQKIESVRAELQRNANVIFGLIIHNLSTQSYIIPSLIALKRLMESLTTLQKLNDEFAVFKLSKNIVCLPPLSITELTQSLCNLLAISPTRDYTQKEHILRAANAFVVYIAHFNKTIYSPIPIGDLSQMASLLDGSDSYFKKEESSVANNLLLKDLLLEAAEMGSHCSPSLRHPLSYITQLISVIISTWPLLNPSPAQNSVLAIWLSKLVSQKSPPEIPVSDFVSQLLPIALSCWKMMCSTLDQQTVSYMASGVLNQLDKLSVDEIAEDSINWHLDALMLSAANLEDSSYIHIHNRIINVISRPDFIERGKSLVCLRVFVQTQLALNTSISIQLAESYLSSCLPMILSHYLSQKLSIDKLSKTEIEIRQEILKLLALLQSRSLHISDSDSVLCVVVSSLIQILNNQQSTQSSQTQFGSNHSTNSFYSIVHDSALQILLHLAQTLPEPFKKAFGQLSNTERQKFEIAVRANIEKQQAAAAAVNASKMKFSLDTSKYS